MICGSIVKRIAEQLLKTLKFVVEDKELLQMKKRRNTKKNPK